MRSTGDPIASSVGKKTFRLETLNEIAAHGGEMRTQLKREHVRGIREKIARVIFERRTPGRQATAATRAHWFAASERFEETIRLRLFKQLIRDPNECGATGG